MAHLYGRFSIVFRNSLLENILLRHIEQKRKTLLLPCNKILVNIIIIFLRSPLDFLSRFLTDFHEIFRKDVFW